MEIRKYVFTTVAVTAMFALLSACGSIETAYVETQSDSFSEEFKRDMKAAIVGRGSAAPFGLNWGDSERAVNEKGVVLSKCKENDEWRWCEATNLKTPFTKRHIVTPYDRWTRNAYYYLDFDPVYGLRYVTMQAPFRTTRDKRGEKGRLAFDKTKEFMMELYGAPYSDIDKDNSTARGVTYYKCLADAACGQLTSHWRTTANGYASIRLKSAKNDDNYDPFYKKFGQLEIKWWIVQ